MTAAQRAISSPLLDDISIEGATGILINFTGGLDLKIAEIEEAASPVEDAAHEDVNLIFGAVIDESISDEIRITVIATGFEDRAKQVTSRFTERRTVPGYQVIDTVSEKPLQVVRQPIYDRPRTSNERKKSLFIKPPNATSRESLDDESRHSRPDE